MKRGGSQPAAPSRFPLRIRCNGFVRSPDFGGAWEVEPQRVLFSCNRATGLGPAQRFVRVTTGKATKEPQQMHSKIRSAALLMILLPAAALAQSATPRSADPDPERAAAREKMRAACAADIQKFCAGIERGKGQMRACLETHQKDLSPACQAARAERAALRAKEKR